MLSRIHPPPRPLHSFTRELERVILSVLGAGVLLSSANAHCESVQQAGLSPSVESAHIDFRIVVPKVIRLDMATGTLVTNARAAETVLVTVEQGGERRTSTSRADRVSIRRAGTHALESPSSDGSIFYTVAMP